MQYTHEAYMQRCLELAQKGAGFVAPNPLVGAVLVFENRIIGEGYHLQFGKEHAEVNCLASVAEADLALVPLSTLYVSLEPCAHQGKTPPCVDLIIRHRIPKLVIGCKDPFEKVAGKGIARLREAGIEVIEGVLEKEAVYLNRRFFCFHQKKRPYILLKWAETGNGKMAGNSAERLLISNEYTNRLVHQWRSEEAAILIGTNTALVDNPQLTNRLYTGKSPLRMVIDKKLRLPTQLHLFDGSVRTILFNEIKQDTRQNPEYWLLKKEENTIRQILGICYQHEWQSILVEGGKELLQSFIDEGFWDEARLIQNGRLRVSEGMDAPRLKKAPDRKEHLQSDTIFYYSSRASD
ncbi:MAG: hypothetical protein RLZZ28_1997 [Bacteroidota bacterium]